MDTRKDNSSLTSSCPGDMLLPSSTIAPWGDKWREPEKDVLQLTKNETESCKEDLMGHRGDIKPRPGQKADEEEGESVGMCDRLMLVSSLFSIEMCMSFQQLYQVLFLQFLGVPLALVSLDGIMAGTVGMFILPLVGSWADGGNNSKRRKMIAMAGSLAVFVTGLMLLIAASCMKMQKLDNLLGILNARNTTHSLLATNSGSYAAYTVVVDKHNNTEETIFSQDSLSNDTVTERSESSHEENDRSYGIVIISILGFTCIDLGFDLTIALSRASILDVVPKCQHKQVLVLATIVQSVAGFICAAIGCFDLPEVLRSISNADGTAATLIFFCCVLMTTSFVSFSLMGVANYRFNKSKTDGSIGSDFSDSSESLKTYGKERLVKDAFNQLEEKASLSVRGPTSRLKQLQDNQVFASSPMPSGTADTYKQPLLLHSLNPNYLTINTGTSQGTFDDVDPLLQGSLTSNFEVKSIEDKNTVVKCENCNPTSGGSAYADDSLFSCAISSNSGEQESSEEETAPSVLEAINQPYSMAMTPIEALNVLEIDHIKEDEDTVKMLDSEKWEDRYRKMKKKLLILCVSSFFTIGASISYSIYAFNALNIGIMHGDPTALPGSEGRRNYEKGLKFGSFGNMVFYTSFLLISLNTSRVIRMIGEKGQFIMNHVILVIGLVAVITTKRQDVFIVFIGCCGFFRPCMLTLPFVLAHQFAQEGMPAEDEEPDHRRSYTGRVMTLIGLLVPAHYCLMSVIMGPLMEATGNPWVPLFYCLGASSVSLGVFSLLFFF